MIIKSSRASLFIEAPLRITPVILNVHQTESMTKSLEKNFGDLEQNIFVLIV